MGEITLIRHGQANSAAQTEEDYDRLSALGMQQAAWLGEHLRAKEPGFDRVLTGTLQRHIATADAMGDMGAAPEVDARLDELDYFNLGRALEDKHGVPFPEPETFAAHVPQVMEAWHAAEIKGRETFARFETRVTGVLTEAAQPGRRVLCVTSGGVIAMMMRHLLGLDPRRLATIMLPIRNTSIHRINVTLHGTMLGAFNGHPHLDMPERQHALTHY